MLFNFILHTEPRVNPPEFTVICQTQGGPAQQVEWFLNGHSMNANFVNQSKVVLYAGSNPVYNNNIYVRGRLSGMYKCVISNSVSSCSAVGNITGILMLLRLVIIMDNYYSCRKTYCHFYYNYNVKQYSCQYQCVLDCTT